ncbi:SDR family NAD(P)-dependent oxidoreductase [Anabaena minutissima FACHB-250]|uniref:PuwB n=1 Tax=Anabaena minutissima UTEX B 1613 TaxID=2303153 RepID=A0A346GB43_9NOST|nr:PuwB [Anabaena minutissima UTEX B 1613]MBD2364812.1 SDR family NAD(P)-dependent oxidoreductase [Anabaena minutissima FACHB-250]
MDKEPIAIIGIGCRFPGAKNPEAFWHLLRDGIDAITEVPKTRWDIDDFYDADPATPDKMTTRWGGFLEQIDQFDPQFFNIAPREAASVDPQHRLLLETTWEALEDAGQNPTALAGKPAGVFMGISSFDYDKLRFQNPVNLDSYAGTGTALSLAANRISYALNFTGPSIAIDTACSSSLVAVHLACQSLRNGESTLALAGGVNVMASPWVTVTFSKGGFMAADGRCKAFDSRANGYVRSEGAGVVVLKLLSQAEADGDRIYAIIRGSAVNQDGRSNGITAPNSLAQEAVLREAYRQAGVSPGKVQYIEAHGTGTKLGDPIEVKALGKVLNEGRIPGEYCALGSVKTNIGHAEAAAGIAGLIKVALSLKHGQIPASLHFQEANPYIPFDKLPLRVQQKLEPWPEIGETAIAGVSSFGFGGTNAHVVLESQKAKGKRQKQEIDEHPVQLLTLSAKTEKTLQELVQSYQDYLKNHPEVSLTDVCFTAKVGRNHFDYRLAITSNSTIKLQEQLAAFLLKQDTPGVFQGQINSRKHPKVVFLFTGQGSQYVDMGRKLYETHPTFRQILDDCNEILQPYLETPLLEILYPQSPVTSPQSPINETAYTQPALFALEYALAKLWQSWGIEPSAVMGHSVGEYVAACLAGVFSLEDGLKLIAERGRLMQALPPDGAMAAIMADEQTVLSAIQPYGEQIAIAAYNGAESLVISGQRQAIAAVCQQLTNQGIQTKPLQVSHAFHSPLMEAILGDFEQVAKTVQYSFPQIPLISNLTGQIATTDIATPEYWVHHIRQPVQFASSMKLLHQQGYQIFVEIGAKPTLIGMGRQCLPDGVGVWLPSLHPKQGEWEQILASLAALYVRGIPINWGEFYRHSDCEPVSLPTYPFQRQRYWIEAVSPLHQPSFKLVRGQQHPLLGQRLNLAGVKEICFQSEISQNQPAYLPDHRVFGEIIVPATAYLEMALAAGYKLYKSVQLVLEDISILQPLILGEVGITLQISLSPGDGSYSFQIFSSENITDTESLWRLHATGKLLRGENQAEPIQTDLTKLRSLCHENITPLNYYQQCQNRGIDYGSSFQAIQQLWYAPGLAMGQVQLAETWADQNYHLHPIILDAGFQVLGAALLHQNQVDTYLPVGIKRLQIHSSPGNLVWSHAEINPDTNQELINSNVSLYTEDGVKIVYVEGLELKRWKQSRLLPTAQENWHNWLYQVEWRQKVHFVSSQLSPDYLVSPAQVSIKISAKLPDILAHFDWSEYQQVFTQMEALSVTYIIHAFAQMGRKFQLGQRFATADIITQLGIVNRHHRLLHRLLEIVADAGYLQQSDLQWQVINILQDSNPDTKLNLLLAKYPSAVAELTLLGRCGSKLASVLQGDSDPLQLLFPEGDMTTATQVYQDSPGSQVLNSLVQQAISSALAQLPQDRGVRILEIGAGTGGTTAYILPTLPAQQTEYIFTDLSPRFTTQAQEKFRDYPFVRYQVLDIEQELKPQGFEFHQYDVVVAANVLHATQDLAQTLQNIRQLLAPQGLLILLEGTIPQAWLDLTFGLTEGWWRFSDTELRPNYPLLTSEQWQQVLLQEGYQAAVTLPLAAATQGSLNQQSVIVAQAAPIQKTVAAAKFKHWLVLSDSQGLGEKLATQLRETGDICTLVFSGEDYKLLDRETLTLNPTQPEHFQQLLTRISNSETALHGVINCWSLDTSDALTSLNLKLTSKDLKAASRQSCGSTLHLLQALTATDFTSQPRLWLVTRGAQSVEGNVSGVTQSALWGMGKVIALEHPELKCVRIDLDSHPVEDEVNALLAEILASDEEDQVAFRHQQRYVARLTRSGETQLDIPENQPFTLTISQKGTLENLTFESTVRRSPDAGEVEIRVRATGLNFRDLLNALDLYPGDAGTLGGECAGEIVAVGAGVSGLAVGDAVVAIAPASFSQYVTVNAQMVAPKPANLTFAEAATIPITFLTAYYSLHHLGKIAPGERVLIHAAAGGVGQAAIQLAQQIGAEVFATASPGKWDCLKSLGVEQIMNSRTLDFAGQIKEITYGQGVNIILNSLTSDEFISKSLSVLQPQGRFVEIAKRGVLQTDEALKVRSDIAYFLVDLVEVCQQQPTLIQSMLAKIMPQFATEQLKPLPQTQFPITNVVDAFRYMQQAKHIGKIVVTQTELTFRADSTYLITGGMGGLGLLVAEWMVEKGARHLVLLGRSGANGEVKQSIKTLQQMGAQVMVTQADVVNLEQMTKVIEDIERSLPPLRGIIHAVGVLDDGVLQQQTWERFTKVMSPKVEGAWNLHQLTQHLPLDFFVLFSSVASLFGSPGQANHAAANAFLDTFAHYRQQQELPGLSINWGVVTDIGAAAKRQAESWVKAKGIGTIAPHQVLAVLEQQMLAPASPQVGVVPVDWSKFNISPFFQDLQPQAKSTEPSSQAGEFLQQLDTIPKGEHRAYLMNHVCTQVATVLGGNPTIAIDIQQGFFDLGMDSLTSVELRNRLQTSLGCSLPSTLTFKYPTVTALVDYLAGEVLNLATPPPETNVKNQDWEAVKQLSDDEVDASIAKEIAELEALLRGKS